MGNFIFALILLVCSSTSTSLETSKDSSCPAELDSEKGEITIMMSESSGAPCMWYRVDVSALNYSTISEVEAAFAEFNEGHFKVLVPSTDRVDLFLQFRSYPEMNFNDWKQYIQNKKINQ